VVSADASAASGLSVRTMRIEDFSNEMEIARAIYNDGWQQNWGFVPATKTDAEGLAHSFKPLLLPDAGLFVCKNDEPIAFALSIPNAFDITADLGAALTPFGWMKLLWRIKRKRYRSFRLVFIGGKTAHHGSGIGKIALAETIRRLTRRGAEQI